MRAVVFVPIESPRRPLGLDDLVTAVRDVVSRHCDWQRTAERVASVLERGLPSASILDAEQRAGDGNGYLSHVLHAEPDGSFSIVALVWLPGQETAIHDHVTWCVFGVVQGVEQEELFELAEGGRCLLRAGAKTNCAGDVSGFAPPGDIHRVRNAGAETAISIHVYGTDVTRIGSSVRRYYELPVLPSEAAA
jgi:predicted metal-dependent enzyme (double-stranded beta helix superfamily)